MNKKYNRWKLFVLPLVAVLMLTSCGDQNQEKEVESEEKEVAQEPLIERDPAVKEYFAVMNNMIEEYLNVGETLLTTAENIDAGDLGLLETAAAMQELYESWDKIEEVEASLAQQGTIKENIEAKLNPKDMLEFKEMYEASVVRLDSMVKRVEAIDFEKYLE